MNFMPFWQLKSFLKILIGVQYENIELFHIPPYTPEMNPIEQIWKEIRKRGFRNEVFATLEKVVDRLCDTICSLPLIPFSALPDAIGLLKRLIRF